MLYYIPVSRIALFCLQDKIVFLEKNLIKIYEKKYYIIIQK